MAASALKSISSRCILVAIPAYNEEATIAEVVQQLRQIVPDLDLIVINDGSYDQTGKILNELGVLTATHLCNLGYGRAIQTAINYALRQGYDALITIDADGQHSPDHILGIVQEFSNNQWDVLIGSRYVKSQHYVNIPPGRRIGMILFSYLVKLLTGQRIYDTTSGLKILGIKALKSLKRGHFVDFHAEAIVYLIRIGHRIGEYPIIVTERQHGQSMYSAFSYVKYPLKTFMMTILGFLEASLVSRKD
jgi:glycosyltransferase involved in cell wall biosynthesis